MFLVVSKDTHCDDAYYPFLKWASANEKARELVAAAEAHYKEKGDVFPIRMPTLFNVRDRAGSWQVLVEEVESPEIDDMLTDLTDIQVWYEDYHSRSYCVFCGKIDNSMLEHHDHCAYKRARTILGY